MPRTPAPSRAATKTRILDAAEELFGEHGFAATSLRNVTDAAGVNIAAVNYHFGSKEGLLRAVAQRAMAATNAERERLLEELTATDDEPAVHDLVRVFVTTGADVVGRHGHRGRHVARVLGRVVCEPDPRIRRLFAAEVGPVEGRFLRALTTALPDLPPSEVAFRYRAMVGLLALHQSGTLVDLHPGEPTHVPDSEARATEQLVTLLTATFTAPASDAASPS
ncbi:TetR/AcrR family transcriptional regulator [Streptomyces sp. MK37H]|uniref:TetR/AcrR family transcriptional regulator n=1 Tax=Streptomyces sp. MK37H TaxID=2699117 RepID=UPI001B371EC9|nr:TetR family transcriptional regulator [Streptomyces sp. MK37H]MBP8533134.1 TetR family transcriptional regulator [Streptomyces sp. MK37H]